MQQPILPITPQQERIGEKVPVTKEPGRPVFIPDTPRSGARAV